MRLVNPQNTQTITSQKIVSSASELEGELDSTKLYIIDGVIDMGDTEILVPEGGLTIRGLGFDISQLNSAEDNYCLFNRNGTYAGNLILENMGIGVIGTNSQVFDLDNDGNSGAVECNSVNFNLCTSIGELTAYRQFRIANVAFFNIGDGLTFSGTWSGGALWSDSIALFIGAGVTIFKEGTGLTFGGSVRCNMNALSIDATTVFCDFQPSNILLDGEMDFLDFRAGNNNPLPNLPHTNVKARFRDCVGLSNTYPGAAWTITTGDTTSISSSNTLYKLAGTTTYSFQEWFSNTTDNACVYDSTVVEEFIVSFSLSLTGNNNRVAGIQLRHWDNSASAYVDIGPRYVATLNGGATGVRAENITGFAYVELGEDDRIEVWIENQTDTTDIDSVVGGSLFVRER